MLKNQWEEKRWRAKAGARTKGKQIVGKCRRSENHWTVNLNPQPCEVEKQEENRIDARVRFMLSWGNRLAHKGRLNKIFSF